MLESQKEMKEEEKKYFEMSNFFLNDKNYKPTDPQSLERWRKVQWHINQIAQNQQ